MGSAEGHPRAGDGVAVRPEFVAAALSAAADTGRDVADVPIAVIARRAGMSRSTLLRRLGGSRASLDEAVRAAGVDPGGAPVRARAVDAAAAIIGEEGLASATIELIAARAGCSVPSMYAVFGTRDRLLQAVFERYSPIADVEAFFAEPHADLRQTVYELYVVIARALSRQPRVVPAMFAEAFARPSSPAVQALFGHAAPRMLGLLGGWLAGEVAAGRVRDLPMLLLIQQFTAPMLMHLLGRPLAENAALAELPDIDTVCEVFTDTFVNAVAIPQKRRQR